MDMAVFFAEWDELNRQMGGGWVTNSSKRGSKKGGRGEAILISLVLMASDMMSQVSSTDGITFIVRQGSR
jgi:hypothetical protein